MGKLKIADTRSENAEMDIQRLNVRIDKEIQYFDKLKHFHSLMKYIRGTDILLKKEGWCNDLEEKGGDIANNLPVCFISKFPRRK